MATSKKTTTALSTARPGRLRNAQMDKNFHLVWLDGSIDETNNKDSRNFIMKLRQIIDDVNTFTDANECIDFISSNEEMKAFLIFSGALGQTTVPTVHDKPQVRSIYIFCGNKARHEKWAKEWPKVAGVYTDMTPICEALKQAIQDCDQNTVTLSLVKTTGAAAKQSLDTLDCSFMYTQILKEILLTIDFEQEHTNDFLSYCREQLADNHTELKNIEKLRREYCDHQPIWWYTYESFLYPMLNRALRLMDVDLIVKMGFFVRDLHNHIVALHSEQYGGHHYPKSFAVYRGQGLSQTDFDQVKLTQGGLLAFNNFLTTSLDRTISLNFAQRVIDDSNLVGVLFVMTIDPSISTIPFAKVASVSYFQGDEEILFSMHAVFRIGQVQKIEKNDRLWQVELTLTSENDPQLHHLTEIMRKETDGSTGWHRLGKLMIKMGQFDKAEELYELLLQQRANERERADLYHQLGSIKDNQGKYVDAVEFYEKSIGLRQEILSPTHADLAASYNNIGKVYCNMDKHSKALSYYEKATEIIQKTLPANHPDLATTYSNIGEVYNKMSDYPKALSYHEKALEIRQRNLPAIHPHLAQSYRNIGLVYKNTSDYSKALSYFERALKIQQQSLSPDHPDLKSVKESIETIKKKL